MAQKNKRIFLYGGVVVLAIAGFLLTEPEAPAATGGGNEPTTRKSTSASSRNSDKNAFTEADENAKFARLNEPVQNAFKPEVIEQGKSSRGKLSDLPNAIPPSFMNGQSGWFLTGIATFDGRTVALLENNSTNEGTYLGVGESLYQATLTGIDRNTVTLRGANGEVKAVTLLEDRPIVDEDANARNEPFNPMSGTIGISAQNNADNRSASTAKTGTENEPTN